MLALGQHQLAAARKAEGEGRASDIITGVQPQRNRQAEALQRYAQRLPPDQASQARRDPRLPDQATQDRFRQRQLPGQESQGGVIQDEGPPSHLTGMFSRLPSGTDWETGSASKGVFIWKSWTIPCRQFITSELGVCIAC